MITKVEIGAKIRVLRIKAGLSQSELGKLLKRSHAAISDIERGKTKLSLIDLLTIAEYLNTPIAFFLNIQSNSQNLSIQFNGNISSQNPVDSKGLNINVAENANNQSSTNLFSSKSKQNSNSELV